MLKWMRKTSIRQVVQVDFFASGGAFLAASILNGYPLAVIGLLMFGTFFLILLNICVGLQF